MELSMHKKTIMIDLDGVLNNYVEYDANLIPEIKKGAFEFIKKLYKTNNYELILYTTRNIKMSYEWLIKNNLDKYFSNITNIKEPAHIYIDDRAINFSGDYNKTFKEINNFKVYWE